MRILLHQCCAPCSIYPVRMLKEAGFDISAYFYNPNIHPVQEFYARLEQAADFNEEEGIGSIIDETYGLEEFVRNAAYREKSRCLYCYAVRIEQAARTAKRGKFDCFTTTLLYSRYQDHDLMVSLAEEMAKKYGVMFHYEDYREGWKEGIEVSKAKGMYRQQYCGCIYSEEDRYLKQLSGRFNKRMEKA
ncbi:epoxyqueuosine reductase QueH [Limisalsivibrio acetivorans]|uniref:epoxyqueuosine reductase QueH n=1 Tax=Limisalsivibrio acetivorans TaxID=1304888 RepID=UPI0003B77954|nr:epoxyqueuosine reductase QueH [Limisalsivibrio acetivorans]